MSHNSLEVYYKTLWIMTYDHGYSISDIENLIPFELTFLIELTAKRQRQKEEAAKMAMLQQQ